MTVHSIALVGTVGGAGTTRLAVELGAAIARTGGNALVLDLDLDTQGLASMVPGRLSPDSTRLLTEPGIDLPDAVHEADIDVTGSLGLCPAHAPFTRVAEAKTPEAAQRLEDRLAEATNCGYDAVIIDTPPVASNPAVAAVTAADRTGLVASPDERGVDAIQRSRGRLADVDASEDTIITTRTTPDASPPAADIAIPEASNTGDGAHFDALGDAPFAQAVTETAELLFERTLDIDHEPAGRFGSLRQRLS